MAQNNRIILGIAAIFSIAVILNATLSVIGAIPSKATAENGNIVLKTRLGKPVVIPEEEVTYMESSRKPGTLRRTHGLSMGKYHSGYFTDLATGQKYYLFLSGSGQKLTFKYKDVIYEVDSTLFSPQIRLEK